MKRRIIIFFINAIILLYTFLFLAYTVSCIGANYNSYGINTIWGVGYISVSESNNLYYKSGDMVFIKYADQNGLKDGDIVLYRAKDSKLMIDSINTAKDSIIIGRCIFAVPYLGTVINYAKNGMGVILLIIVPAVLISLYIFTIITDDILDNKRHRKRIVRRKNRRRNRYKNEGMHGPRRAVI